MYSHSHKTAFFIDGESNIARGLPDVKCQTGSMDRLMRCIQICAIPKGVSICGEPSRFWAEPAGCLDLRKTNLNIIPPLDKLHNPLLQAVFYRYIHQILKYIGNATLQVTTL